ncbi:hypothetical protein J8F10_00340 [Gemmata sp. G18]|uniref:Carboxypeptidase regulatory-like domain-containing protein n=1 Tax=Gemmata palustris TaxID=2822762 RepID=A0ABS5BJ76_9BACT|nr:hypothetical protein [Gemmata palustris]MBP3953749.1 hypothetical protein [Gemmata palustris]
MNRLLSAAVFCTALTTLIGCGGREGPPLYPVSGIVRVNGQPAERVTVNFQRTDPAATGNAAHPSGVTDADGRFRMSTNKEGDGAAEGEYVVTFTWQSDPDSEKAADLFSGKYRAPKTSKFRAKVGTGPTELEPFELVAEPTQAKKFVK